MLFLRRKPQFLGILVSSLLGGQTVRAIQLDVTNTDSIKSAASTCAYGLMNYYKGNLTGMPVGLLPDPFYWWEAGAMFGQMIEYWYYTGDSTYNDVVMQGMLAQTGPDNDYMPNNQTKTEGNDDQVFWAFAAMSAAELNFPAPPGKSPSWLALAQAVFNLQVSRWDTQHCGGGLRWQIFTFNNGYDYKNTISNGGFFQLAARLARYTGNQTYADWAEKSYDWIVETPLFTDQFIIYDGAQIENNCTVANKLQWTYNIGTYLMGAVNMYNHTNGNSTWETRIQGMLKGLDAFFPTQYGGGNYMVEIACEPTVSCNNDQPAFKAFLSRWMAAATQIAPFTADALLPKLKTSAQGAASQCSGGSGSICGRKWYQSTWDGKSGPGEQMSALSIIQANLITKVAAPVTADKGGTSKGDPSAGSGGDNPSIITDPNANKPVTVGDKAGAGILTALEIRPVTFITSPHKKRKLSPPDTVEFTSDTQNTSSSPFLASPDPAANNAQSPTIPRHIPQHLALKGARTGRSPTPESANTAGSSPSGAFAGVTLDSDGYVSGTDTTGAHKRRGSLASSSLRGGASSPVRSSSPAKRRALAMNNADVDMDKSQDSDTTTANRAPSAVDTVGHAPKRDSKSQGTRHRREMSVDMLAEETDSQDASLSAGVESGSEPTDVLPIASYEIAPLALREPEKDPSNAHYPEALREFSVPDLDQRIEVVTQRTLQGLHEGEKGYVVANKWLCRVFARGSDAEISGKYAKEAKEGPIGPVDNTGMNLITDPSYGGELKDEDGLDFVPLRPGLSLREDFEILPMPAWDLVINWYGLAKGSPIISRFCHATSSNPNQRNIQWELHPPIFTFLKLPICLDGMESKTSKERDAAPVKLLASRGEKCQKFLKRAKENTNIDLETKVRVWRILDGLGNGGLVTPATSRSNSPAPGIVTTVDPGDRLLLDAHTFSRLQIGSQRELIQVEDETGIEEYRRKKGLNSFDYMADYNKKDNSKISLDDIGLRQNEVIVLEEQVDGPGGRHWASDPEILQKSKTGSGTPFGITTKTSGGIMTRGRQAKNGRTRGTVGLSNLGNTCYMNSALQCVRSAEELTYYFLEDQYRKELNPSNPLSHNGQVAKSYASLLQEMYNPGAINSIAPRNFKNVIGKYGPSFSGYQQQDSQEFLLFLLDGLQEDLNRIHKKPYIEKPDSTDEMVHDPVALKEMADKCWAIYKARNDSVITDLFAGMYKSTVVCPQCDKVSIIFDPFNNLTLQLPIESLWSRDVLVFPLHSKPVTVKVDIDKNASFMDLKEFVAVRAGIDPEQTMVAELYKKAFYRVFQDSATLSEEHIVESDVIGIWEFPGRPTNYPPTVKKSAKSSIYSNTKGDDKIPEDNSPAGDRMLVPVFHRRVSGSRQTPLIGIPSFITVDREESKDYDTILRKVLARAEVMTTRDFLREENGSDEDGPDSTAEDSDTVLMTPDGASEIHAKSLESEDGMIDISMRNSEHKPKPCLGKKGRPLVEPTRRPTAPMLKPQSFITPAVRNLFELKILPAQKTIIPVGIAYIAEDQRYETLSSRQSDSSGHPRTTLDKVIERRQSNLGGIESNSDGEGNDIPPLTQNHQQGPEHVSDSDDGLPPVEQIVQPKVQPSTGFGTFNKSTPRDPKGLITYSRKGTRVASRMKPRKERITSRETTPIEGSSLLRLGESILVDWNAEACDALFNEHHTDNGEDQMRGTPTWRSPPTLPDPELVEMREIRANRRKNGVTLGDCLDEFGKPEILSENDAWYCPRCKEHRRASKTFELWKAPDILVVHLKRFSAHGRLRDKLDVFVNFPVEGLDLSTRLAVQEDGKSPVYDLFAVDNHYGGLGGGHYTAYAQNFLDKSWYEYNDSAVSRRSNPKAVVTSAAYLLFYRRRSPTPLGGPLLERLIAGTLADNSESQSNSRPASPAGEGKRLDDSSRTGSSSAFCGVGVAHQAGGGGSMDGTEVRTVRKGIDDDDPADGLPAYTAQGPRGTLDPRELQESTLESMEEEEDEGIGGMDDGVEPSWRGPLKYDHDCPSWRFGSTGLPPGHNSPRDSGEEGDGPDEDLFADDSSMKVDKSDISEDLENRMADFNDDEGTTSGAFGTPPPESVPLLDVPVHSEEIEGPVAEVIIDDDVHLGPGEYHGLV